MISLFKMMPEYAVQWFIANSNERRAEPNEVLIHENSNIDSLFIVLSGLLGIYLNEGKEFIGTIGTGTVLGEISFVDESPSSASVIVREKSLLLEVPRVKLTTKINGDPYFAADFYKALAATLSERLRKTNEKLAAAQETDTEKTDGIANSELKRDLKILGNFRDIVIQADQEIIEKGQVENESYKQLRTHFRDVIVCFHDSLGPGGVVPISYREQIGARLQHEMLPQILLSDTAERFFSKPRGYAADFESVERIYASRPSGKGRMGAVMDRLFLECPIASAIRNRREIFSGEILHTVKNQEGSPAKVLGVACGSARELSEVFAQVEDKSKIAITLLDIDTMALNVVSEWTAKIGVQDKVKLLNENLINLALGRAKIDIPPQDLIYCTGLIDYFDDRQAIKLMNFMHSLLAPGGRVILGGFHPDNICKEFMEYLLEWHVHHRNQKEMDLLFQQSSFNSPCTRYTPEAEKVNFFAECIKA